MCPRRIKLGQWADLLDCLISSTADNSWRFEIELSKIAAGVHVVWSELDRSFELGAHFSCQSSRGQEARLIGFLSVDSSQPEMVLTVARCERHRLFASRNSPVPLPEREVSTAKEVVSNSVVGRRTDLPMERDNGFINMT